MITEDNFLDFKCPYCGMLNSFPADSAGFVRECVNCMDAVIVPADGGEMGGRIPLPLATPALVLRPLTASDLKDLMELKPDSDEEEWLRWLEEAGKVKLAAVDHPFCLGIEVQDRNKLIGYLGLQFTNRDFMEAEISIGVDVKPEFHEFVREAVVATLGMCFRDLSIHRVIARCSSNNVAVGQLFAEAGMRREGEFVKHYRVEGGWCGTVWFAMLEEEFLAGGNNSIDGSSS